MFDMLFELSQDQLSTLTTISKTCATISIIGSTLVFFMACRNNVSFPVIRFTIHQAVADLIYAIDILYSFNTNIQEGCFFASILKDSSRNLSVTMAVHIAGYSYWKLIRQSYGYEDNIDKIIFFSYIISFFIGTSSGVYNYLSDTLACGVSTYIYSLLGWLLEFMPVILGTLVVCYLYRRVANFINENKYRVDKSSIILVPITLMTTWVSAALDNFLRGHFQITLWPLMLMHILLTRSIGIMNTIIYLFQMLGIYRENKKRRLSQMENTVNTSMSENVI